jgi:hypothetical protein
LAKALLPPSTGHGMLPASSKSKPTQNTSRNGLYELIRWRIMAAFEIRNLDSDQVGMPGDEFGSPNLL